MFKSCTILRYVSKKIQLIQINKILLSTTSKNINMNITSNINIPHGDANLTGFNLINKRAANMVYTIYGEKSLTKILQIGNNTKFVESLGRVSRILV